MKGRGVKRKEEDETWQLTSKRRRQDYQFNQILFRLEPSGEGYLVNIIEFLLMFYAIFKKKI